MKISTTKPENIFTYNNFILLIVRYLALNLCAILITTTPVVLLSQSNNLGDFLIDNYSKENFGGGIQTWDVKYHKNGILVFGNNSGLLLYNGVEWKLLSTPKKTIIRSIDFSADQQKIFVGGQDEIGYFEISSNGILDYVDLIPLLPKDASSLEDVWEMINIDSKLYFRSNNTIYRYDEDKIITLTKGKDINFISEHSNKLIYNDLEEGLFVLNENKIEKINDTYLIKNTPLVGTISLSENSFLVLTEKKGIFKYEDGALSDWESNANEYLSSNKILSGIISRDKEKIIIGTFLGGIVILDKNGKAIYKLDKQDGLQNNTITKIYEDERANLWLCTFNGIDKVKTQDNSTKFYPDVNLQGIVYDIEIWKNSFYFATSNGLYCIPKKDYYNPFLEKKYNLITNTSGQCWGLDLIDNNLMLAHDEGAFQVLENNTALKISQNNGSWKFIKLSDNLMIVGTYNGVNLYKKEGQLWKFVKEYLEFKESSRIMVFDDKKTIWVSHPYKGIFKINLENDNDNLKITKVIEKDGIPNLLNCYVHNVLGELFVTNDEGVYRYNYEEELFELDEKLVELFNGEKLKRLIDFQENGIWYISDTNAGKINLNRKGFDTDLSREILVQNKNTFVGGFENIFVFGDDQIFSCTDKGIIYIKPQKKSVEPIDVFLVNINTISPIDSNIYNNLSFDTSTINLTYSENDLIFDYASDYMEKDLFSIKYSYYMEGQDEGWSPFTTKKSKEYTNLKPGKYVFNIKAKTIDGTESNIKKYEIYISPPWYLSKIMKLIYGLFFTLFVITLILLPKKKLKKERQQMLKEKEKSDSKVEDLKNQNLQNEIQFKNKELANVTMHLLQKSETIKSIEQEIEKVRQHIKDPQAKKEVKKLINIINSDSRLEDDWNNFSYHFDQVHHNFLQRIKSEYPSLSNNDLKLCAYLRLNLSTKEIAPLLNISTRGIEISRYRLRKKLNLETIQNLNEFMISY